jgi:hypothetical protein
VDLFEDEARKVLLGIPEDVREAWLREREGLGSAGRDFAQAVREFIGEGRHEEEGPAQT